MTRIKMCGMFRKEDIEAVNEIHPDYAGFIIDFPKSHRNLSPDGVRKLRARLDTGIIPVGVFVDAPVETVAELLLDGTIEMAQLHGNETDAYIDALKGKTGKPVIKAFQVGSEDVFGKAIASHADFVLFDSGKGEGRAYDFTVLQDFSKPYFLAGGVNASNVRDIIQTLHPFAMDISSGIETDRVKDPVKMKQFADIVRSCADQGE